jgi:hypothetical protein
MNNWDAIDRLAATHRADLVAEAARDRLAVPATRGEERAVDRTMPRLPRLARAAFAACAGRSVTTL